ncbi:hypothetical protein [Streptomyces solaniscabiei]|uniref:hypothetical protein n=1 Tax=Streptomyces solaniscabiei TaxID=2683255 RepID=UPI001CE38AA3|nr:hypothetical protein [Streptomyces solaniscabiei]
MNPYAVLAAAAAEWHRLADRVTGPTRERLAALLTVVRHREAGEPARRGAAEEAAGLLRRALPDEFGTAQEARLATGVTTGTGSAAETGTDLSYLGFRADDLAVLLLDGHRMVGPVLGPVRDRLLAEPALDPATVLRDGGDPYARDLIRLPGPGGLARLPRFQFAEGCLPWLVVLEVNGLLDAARDPWGAADWWLAGNAWLGTTPAALLGTGQERRLADTARLLTEDV